MHVGACAHLSLHFARVNFQNFSYVCDGVFIPFVDLQQPLPSNSKCVSADETQKMVAVAKTKRWRATECIVLNSQKTSVWVSWGRRNMSPKLCIFGASGFLLAFRRSVDRSASEVTFEERGGGRKSQFRSGRTLFLSDWVL